MALGPPWRFFRKSPYYNLRNGRNKHLIYRQHPSTNSWCWRLGFYLNFAGSIRNEIPIANPLFTTRYCVISQRTLAAGQVAFESFFHYGPIQHNTESD